ncbi:hypothetical protein ACFVFQ_04540 [Streptomyces sp. NPDC057743]|uniref:hypothetical protein n=1 Tax=Streptomyces sp. NPDC057743 TaxID=3346236 RepID=UPI0036B20B44
MVLEATAHIDTWREELFAFLDPLCEQATCTCCPPTSTPPGPDSCSRCSPDGPLADRWAGQADGEHVELQKELAALSLRMICGFALGGAETDTDRSDLIGALVEAGQSPARIRDTVVVTLLAAHHRKGG